MTFCICSIYGNHETTIVLADLKPFWLFSMSRILWGHTNPCGTVVCLQILYIWSNVKPQKSLRIWSRVAYLQIWDTMWNRRIFAYSVYLWFHDTTRCAAELKPFCIFCRFGINKRSQEYMETWPFCVFCMSGIRWDHKNHHRSAADLHILYIWNYMRPQSSLRICRLFVYSAYLG